MKSRLGSLRLYKIDVPAESDVGVLVVSHEGISTGQRFRLTRHTGRQGIDSKAGLSKTFVDLVDWFFLFNSKDYDITNQVFTYMASNFCFRNLEFVPPGSPVLVFHVVTREYNQNHVPDTDIASVVLDTLRTEETVMDVEDAIDRLVPIAPPTTEIVDCYRSSDESCCLCGKGYPKENEIVHKTKCNHIFHGTCISGFLLRTLHCPVCSTQLPPVDIRTLLFF